MRFSTGDFVPWFQCPSSNRPDFQLNAVAGRYIALTFFKSTRDPVGARILSGLKATRPAYDDKHASWFGVTIDRADATEKRVENRPPFRWFFDVSGNVSKGYGAIDETTGTYDYHTIILDPFLRAFCTVPVREPEAHLAEVAEIVAKAPAIPGEGWAELPAPVLVLPRVFEPELCRALIEYYRNGNPYDSGFMVAGKGGTTVGKINHGFKRRKDVMIEDPELARATTWRLRRRVFKGIERAFQFQPTQIERYLVARYAGEEEGGGYFGAHRDNTTTGTAHRKFAVTINLNAEEFEGGGLAFPEFGRKLYKAPTGGAVVFSCSLLHQAMPVLKGERFCFLPFIYDDAGKELRQKNMHLLVETPRDENGTPLPEASAEAVAK